MGVAVGSLTWVCPNATGSVNRQPMVLAIILSYYSKAQIQRPFFLSFSSSLFLSSFSERLMEKKEPLRLLLEKQLPWKMTHHRKRDIECERGSNINERSFYKRLEFQKGSITGMTLQGIGFPTKKKATRLTAMPGFSEEESVYVGNARLSSKWCMSQNCTNTDHKRQGNQFISTESNDHVLNLITTLSTDLLINTQNPRYKIHRTIPTQATPHTL